MRGGGAEKSSLVPENSETSGGSRCSHQDPDLEGQRIESVFIRELAESCQVPN
jgi:hypothetical protein